MTDQSHSCKVLSPSLARRRPAEGWSHLTPYDVSWARVVSIVARVWSRSRGASATVRFWVESGAPIATVTGPPLMILAPGSQAWKDPPMAAGGTRGPLP